MAKSKHWSRERVLSEIKRRHQKGWRLNTGYMQKNCGKLLRSSMHHFGTWAAAITAAGIEYENVCIKRSPHSWSRKEITAEIKKRKSQGEKISAAYIARNGTALYRAACKLFGSWKKAVKAAGIDYRSIQLCVPGKWNKRRLLKAIRERIARGLSLSQGIRFFDPEARKLHSAARVYFGSMSKALRCAGYDPYKYIAKQKYWSKERIIRALRKRLMVGQGLTKKALMQDNDSLYHACFRYFGSRLNALWAANIDPEVVDTLRRWDREKVISEIQHLHKNGESLLSSYLTRKHNTLISAMRAHFGSWSKAMVAAGFSLREHRLRNYDAKWVLELDAKMTDQVIKRTLDLIAKTKNRKR